MPWITAIAIMVAAVLINHLGLITAIEGVIKHRLPIINCPKCLTFWSVVLYLIITADYTTSFVPLLRGGIQGGAVALLLSYAAYWFELFLGIMDKLYNKAYDALYTDTGGASDALPADRETDTDAYVAQHPTDAVPMVR